MDLCSLILGYFYFSCSMAQTYGGCHSSTDAVGVIPSLTLRYAALGCRPILESVS